MNLLLWAAIALPGFTACAEFGSYAFVHPVIKKLPPREHVFVEKGLVKTFGRVMPVLMTASLIALIAFAISLEGGGVRAVIAWVASVVWACGLATTLAVNVGINAATSRWEPENPPPDWKATRNRWERFQAIRSWAFLIAFALVCAAVALD